MTKRIRCTHTVQASIQCCLAVVFAVLLPHSSGAQGALSLRDAIKNALANRKNIQAGRLDQTIRKLQTDALYRKYWPQVSMEYMYQYNPILQTSILPIGVFNPSYPADATMNVQFGTKWNQTAGLTLYQPLIDVSVNRQIREAELQERIAAAAQSQTEYELAYTVAQTYLEISLQETRLRSAAADTQRTWTNYQLLSTRYGQKRLLRSDVNKAKVNHNNAVQQYLGTLADWIENKVYLKYLTGETDMQRPDITVDTAFPGRELNTISTLPADIASIPDVQQLQLKEEEVAAQTRTERAKYLPTLGLKGYLGANQYTNTFNPLAENSWFGLSYVGIDLKYPLLNGEDKQKRLQQLQLQAGQYSQQKDDKAAQYYKDALVAQTKMQQVQAELKLQEENRMLSNETMAILQARVSEGQESTYNLNTEEAELQKLEASYQGNRRQYWLYYLDYLKASGQLRKLWE